MSIRYKLTFQFLLLVLIILLMFSVGIYYFSSSYRKNDFNARLKDRAMTVGKLLIDVQEIDSTMLNIINQNTYALYKEEIIILNDNGDVIFNNNYDIKPKAEIFNSINAEKEYYFESNERQNAGIVYKSANQNFIVIVSAYDKFGISKLENLEVVLAIELLIAVFMVFVIGLFYATRALQPINKIIKDVRNISANNLSSRLSEGNKKDEIAKLSITFNQMISRIEESFEIQKTFFSGASHELKTPITIILGEIELALQKPHITEKESKAILESISEEMHKLNTLSSNFLDLARASSNNNSFGFDPLRIDELLMLSIEKFGEMYPNYTIQISEIILPDDSDKLIVKGNEHFLKLCFYNIMENACKFSDNNKVEVKLTSFFDYVRIDFSDQGIGIAENEKEKVFQTFYRSKKSENYKGYGLGLALTKKIIELHNGNILLESSLNKGSVFSIELPVIQKCYF